MFANLQYVARGADNPISVKTLKRRPRKMRKLALFLSIDFSSATILDTTTAAATTTPPSRRHLAAAVAPPHRRYNQRRHRRRRRRTSSSYFFLWLSPPPWLSSTTTTAQAHCLTLIQNSLCLISDKNLLCNYLLHTVKSRVITRPVSSTYYVIMFSTFLSLPTHPWWFTVL